MYGSSAAVPADDDDEHELDEEDAAVAAPGRLMRRSRGLGVSGVHHNAPIVRLVYVLGEYKVQGLVWPWLKFQKVDVLLCALHGSPCLTPEEEPSDDGSEFLEVPTVHLPRADWMRLPIDLIVEILVMALGGRLHPRHLRLSRLLYTHCLPLVYAAPQILLPNFFQFVEAILNNKALGRLVRTLDMRQIQQSGKNLFVLRLLRRCAPLLELFTAPQTLFGYAPLVLLRHCHQLRVLDLRLVLETVDLRELFEAMQLAPMLTQLSFPRLLMCCDRFDFQWPPHLRYLRLSGGLEDEFIYKLTFPATINQLEFAHCPHLLQDAVRHLLCRIGTNITHLLVQYPMPKLGADALDHLFWTCPRLLVLDVAVDYISDALFDDVHLPPVPSRPLRDLLLDSSGMLGQSDKVHPDDLMIAVVENRMPALKNVRISAKLGWVTSSSDVGDLVNELEERGGGLYMGY